MAVRTNRDLYAQLTALGVKLARGLGPREPDLDAVVRLLTAAGTAEPAEFEDAWLSQPGISDPSPQGLARVESILIRQIADLRRMRDNGQLADDNRYFGLDAPGGARWYNFDPTSYLECGVVGSVGGTDHHAEVALVTPPEPCDDDDETRASFGWDGLCALLRCGQSYE